MWYECFRTVKNVQYLQEIISMKYQSYLINKEVIIIIMIAMIIKKILLSNDIPDILSIVNYSHILHRNPKLN